MALITAAEAKANIPELTGTDEDSALDTLIAAVGGAMAQWCGYPPASASATPTMESTSYVRYLDGPGGRVLTLDVLPVTAVTSIYDDIEWTWGSDALVAAADYGSGAWEGAVGSVLLIETSTHGAWSKARRSIKATFTAGFATVPAPVKRACVLAVRHHWNLQRTMGYTSVGAEGGLSVGLVDPASLPRETLMLLAPYRLPSVLL